MGTLFLVHGTGVRLKGYTSSLSVARETAKKVDLKADIVDCAWGDSQGTDEFEGASLPDPIVDPKRDQQIADDVAQWSWLLADPLFELEQLSQRNTLTTGKLAPAMPGRQPEWLTLWEKISRYVPSLELNMLLQRGHIDSFWPEAWARIIKGSTIPRSAFEASAHELADVCRALARAVVAQLHVEAENAGLPEPNRVLRNSLYERLLTDWDQRVFGLGAFFANRAKRIASNFVRKQRGKFSNIGALAVGDILLYQSRGAEIRDFIRAKIANAPRPVTLLAHSLGGIACVDLLALPDPPVVDFLVTIGSQAPLFNELGALTSLRRKEPLPAGFPPWLNIYDRGDVLSYVGGRLWPPDNPAGAPGVIDFEVRSGVSLLDAHSDYFRDEDAWRRIAKFIEK